MSYILDALRRADSERERGAVPGIHSPPVPPLVDEPKEPARAQPQALLVAVTVALLLALAGVLTWDLMSGGKEAPAQPVVATAPLVEAGPSAPSQSPSPAVMVPPATVAPAAVPTTVPSAPPVRQAQPVPSPSLTTASPIVTVPVRPATTAAPAPAVPPPQADTRVHAVHELPAHIQRDLPKLVVGGAMYSDTPANRMLIINSQVFHEGDKLSPDLLLQEIKLKSAVFQYKGYRYGVSY